jgi:hypothetical protein
MIIVLNIKKDSLSHQARDYYIHRAFNHSRMIPENNNNRGGFSPPFTFPFICHFPEDYLLSDHPKNTEIQRTDPPDLW